MIWILAAAVLWPPASLGLGVLIGRGIRLADRRERPARDDMGLAA